MALTQLQLEQLFRPLNPSRVKTKQGQSYLESWDVISHLTRIFGFAGWDSEVESELVFESQRDDAKKGWDVAYRAICRLTIRDPKGDIVCVHEDVGTGAGLNQPHRADAHDLALKTAASDALKRAAHALGNQFGTSLYNRGSVASVLGRSLAHPELDPQPEPEEAK